MRIVCLSDTHNKLRYLIDENRVPDGDVLVVAGDFTMLGRQKEVEEFRDQLRRLPHKWKLIVAGNHDLTFETQGNRAVKWLDAFCVPGSEYGRWKGSFTSDAPFFLPEESEYLKQRNPTCLYLEDSGVMINGFTFWGSPWQPAFGNWAFNLPRAGEQLERMWAAIPTGVDVLITHGPPAGVGDFVDDRSGRVGDTKLAEAVARAKPQVHVFGHIHEGRMETGPDGKMSKVAGQTAPFGTTPFHSFLAVNAAICDEAYDAIHDPVVVNLARRPPAI